MDFFEYICHCNLSLQRPVFPFPLSNQATQLWQNIHCISWGYISKGKLSFLPFQSINGRKLKMDTSDHHSQKAAKNMKRRYDHTTSLKLYYFIAPHFAQLIWIALAEQLGRTAMSNTADIMIKDAQWHGQWISVFIIICCSWYQDTYPPDIHPPDIHPLPFTP